MLSPSLLAGMELFARRELPQFVLLVQRVQKTLLYCCPWTEVASLQLGNKHFIVFDRCEVFIIECELRHRKASRIRWTSYLPACLLDWNCSRDASCPSLCLLFIGFKKHFCTVAHGPTLLGCQWAINTRATCRGATRKWLENDKHNSLSTGPRPAHLAPQAEHKCAGHCCCLGD